MHVGMQNTTIGNSMEGGKSLMVEKIELKVMGLVLLVGMLGIVGCTNRKPSESLPEEPWFPESHEPPLRGFELIRESYVPEELPEWENLVRGEYIGGKIVIDEAKFRKYIDEEPIAGEREFPVLMQEWRNEEGWIIERMLVKGVAISDQFVNFVLEHPWEYSLPHPGPPGAKPSGKGIVWIYDVELYHYAFTEAGPTSEQKPPPPPPEQ
jgi:hypothetical protein